MGKMKFEEFTNAVVEKIREYLPESFANANVELQTVMKNNDLKLTGLLIRNADSNISPTIYLEQFFERYQAGEDITAVLENIADVRIRNEVKEVFDVGQISDFERVREKIVPRLVGREWNKALLEQRPHKIIADLAVTYHIQLGHDQSGAASVPITNNLMQAWDVDTEVLDALAMANLPKLLPSTFQSMTEVLGAMFEQELPEGITPPDDAMYVLSNNQKMFGAAAILDKDTMKMIVERFDKFFIIPSSVHEVLIVPATADMDTETLDNMVKEVNQGQVSPEERLSDHVYTYSLKDGLQSAC